MSDSRPCALTLRLWHRPCERCGLQRSYGGVSVKSVKCDGMDEVTALDLERWHRVGDAKLPRLEWPK